MACPTDSWICRASCSSPITTSVSVAGQGGAASRARASSATRSAWAGRSSSVTSSQPRVPYWPRWEGYERRCVSPSPTTVDQMPPPHLRTRWSIRAPSEETNQVLVSHACSRPSATSAPGTAGRLRRGHQEVALVRERDLERVDVHRVAPRADLGRNRDEVAGRARHGRARGGGRRRAGARRTCRRGGEVGDAVEAPGGPDQGADADPGRLRPVEVLHPAVPCRHHLVPGQDDPGVGVARARGQGGLDGGGRPRRRRRSNRESNREANRGRTGHGPDITGASRRRRRVVARLWTALRPQAPGRGFVHRGRGGSRPRGGARG